MFTSVQTDSNNPDNPTWSLVRALCGDALDALQESLRTTVPAKRVVTELFCSFADRDPERLRTTMVHTDAHYHSLPLLASNLSYMTFPFFLSHCLC